MRQIQQSDNRQSDSRGNALIALAKPDRQPLIGHQPAGDGEHLLGLARRRHQAPGAGAARRAVEIARRREGGAGFRAAAMMRPSACVVSPSAGIFGRGTPDFPIVGRGPGSRAAGNGTAGRRVKGMGR